jgi:hypothetical protein
MPPARALARDIDEHDNRLVYGFQDPASRRAAEEEIKPLAHPCYLVAFIVEPPARVR